MAHGKLLPLFVVPLAVGILLDGPPSGSAKWTRHPETAGATVDAGRRLQALPAVFVPNLGQWEHDARFVARIGATTMFLQEDGWTFTLVEERPGTTSAGDEAGTVVNAPDDPDSACGVAVRMTFAGGGARELVAQRQAPGRHHYFLGNDPGAWRSDVPLYRAVRYLATYPGVDVLAREQDGHFEYDLMLQPWAELEAVEIAVEGIEGMSIDADGSLVLATAVGRVRMAPPPSWEEGPSGETEQIACGYVLRGTNRFAFEVPGRRPGWALVVDPGILWSTYLGGADSDAASGGVAVDAQGAVTVAGVTASLGFPTTSGVFQTSHNGGGLDAFVTRLDPSGSRLVFSTFLGGMGSETPAGIALDAAGTVTIAGGTDSVDFPTTARAYDRTFNGVRDAFVAQLSSAGSALVFSTYLGGTGLDSCYAMDLDAQGSAVVAGGTRSLDFPTTPGAYDLTYNGGIDDAFVARLLPDGSGLVYSTFLGASASDDAWALAVDAQGVATVTGPTLSSSFPTTSGAYRRTFSGTSGNTYVARLSASGSSLLYSTYVGEGLPRGVAVDRQGTATVVGLTRFASFPTTPGAFDPTFNGLTDAFVTRLLPDGSNLIYSTFLGGRDIDRLDAVELDSRGNAIVVGSTSSAGFPTTPGAYDTTIGGSWDACVTRLSPDGSSLEYSTFLGGSQNEGASAVALDAEGAATVLGSTPSTDFPTTPNAFDRTYNGGFSDAFLTRLDLLPTGVSAFGRSSPGCNGPLPISVTSSPRIGHAGFAITCGNAPPNAFGLLVAGGARRMTPLPMLGTELWVDLAGSATVAVTSNAVGAAELPVPIPVNSNLIGQHWFMQFGWIGPNAPAPCPPLGISASNALEIVVQF